MTIIHRTRILAGIMAALAAAPLLAQPAARSSSEQTRIDRMAGIARLWGVVKFFHPAIAEREIDWDGALVDALRDLDAASTSSAYRSVVARMLTRLDDPATRVVETASDDASPPPGGSRYDPAPAASLRSRDGVLIIDVAAIVDYWAREDFDSARANRLLMQKGIESARAVVLDLRFDMEQTGARDPYERKYHLGSMLDARLPLLFDGTLQLGAARVREHSGYPPDVAGASDAYRSGILTLAGESVQGMRRDARSLPLLFVVDSTTPDIATMLGALQQRGARIIVEGKSNLGDGSSSHNLDLPDDVAVTVRTSSHLRSDGSSGVTPDTLLPRSSDRNAAIDVAVAIAGRPVRRVASSSHTVTTIDPPERLYDSSSYPSRELRLLGLFRYWNVIHYFFPYRHLIGERWENVLTRHIPEFEQARDSIEYAVAVAHLTTAIHDMHGAISSSALDSLVGTASPDLVVRRVERSTVVIIAGDAAREAGIMPGDIITKIDGKSADERAAMLASLYASSTPQSLQFRIDTHLLLGQAGSTAVLELAGADGRRRMVSLKRSAGSSPANVRSTSVYRMLSDGIGYADLDRLGLEDVAPMFDSLQSARAIIFDIRGYPKGTAWPITQRLTDSTIVVAKFRRPHLVGSELADGVWMDLPSFAFDQLIFPEGRRYKGKIIVLINGEAGSQSEHTCLFLEAAADATFIGSPTMGGNGDITNVALPGGIICYFSGHDVRHADGRQLQRIGILPHIPVEPTVRGIREGSDEVLEAALAFVKSGRKRPAIGTGR